jgi:hypothetical protein
MIQLFFYYFCSELEEGAKVSTTNGTSSEPQPAVSYYKEYLLLTSVSKFIVVLDQVRP